MSGKSSSNPTMKLRDALSSRILDGISIPLIVVDFEMKVRVVNLAAQQILGVSEEALASRPVQDAHPALASLMMKGVIEKAFELGESSVVEGVAFMDAHAEGVIYNFIIDPLVDTKDRVYAATITGVDVTEVHTVRSQLARQNEQLFAMHTVSNALRSSFDLRKSLFIVGTALTSVNDALFDHAMIFLLENDTNLHGTFATERFDPEHVADIWSRLDSQGSFKRLLRSDYPKIYTRVSRLSRVLRRVNVSLYQRGFLLTEVAGKRITITHHDSGDLELSPDLTRVFGDRAYAATPLLSEDKLLGVLMVAANDPKTEFSAETIQLLEMMAAQAAVAISSSVAYQRINDRAQRDSLTGLYNHGYLMSRMHEEVARGKRYGDTFSFLMIDIDHFKQLNDTYLHQTGDEVLLRLSELLLATVRDADVVARYGGEEFSIILPSTTLDHAESFAERLRAEIENALFATDSEGNAIRVTVSIGVSAMPEHGMTEHEIIAKADSALYAAKRGGRNRIAVAGQSR